jgi:hypothetical protein
MSTDFKKILVKDDRLNVSDSVNYAVHKGAQSMTSSQFQAISKSNTSHTWNVQVPSETTLIDRRVLWQSTVILQLTIAGTPAGAQPIQYGLTDALAPFPLHQLASVMTATINNNSVSCNIRDVLPAMLRFNDARELQRYNGYTPTQWDSFLNYSDGVGANSNPLGGFQNSGDMDLLPRGAWVLDAVSTNAPVAGVLTANTPAAGYTGALYVQFTVTEPILISPFIFADPKCNNQAMYGCQNLNFVFNIGDASRVWRSSTGYVTGAVINQFTSSQLIFNFLTPHPSDLLPSRNCVPFYEMPRYITSVSPAGWTAGSVTSLKTSSLQLNQIPDKLILFVRIPQSSQTNSTADSFYPIQSVSINFNNMSGILASATQQDLYRYSVENGSNQNWFEFSGYSNMPDNVTGVGRKVPMVGSVLVLEFGKDIQLVEDFYSSGSLGNFNLQINMNVLNNSAITQANAEIVLITMNSGIFCLERGTSSTYTGILTKQDVLDCSAQEPYYKMDVKRMVGGNSFMDSLKSVIGKLLPHLGRYGKEELMKSNSALAKAGVGALGALGYGASGGMKLKDRLMK